MLTGHVWRNLNDAPVPDSTRILWYSVFHELVPANERLIRIQRTTTDACRHCAMKDTLEHRLTNGGERRLIWEYARGLLAGMLKTVPSRIPEDWLLHPQLKIWPLKRRRAIVWILAQMVLFRSQQHLPGLSGLPKAIKVETDTVRKGQ